ncbi:hypothetical protein [Streptomyces sp. NPDC001744]|uniref:hypothetical protein n=1 Tax=Streptomyces sp. NPDC001744 TaxID=3364606 RepID=UPI0036CDB6ED
MRALWACGLAVGMLGLAGCTGATDDAKDVPPPNTPSAVWLAITGDVDIPLPKGSDAGLRESCTPPSNAKTQIGTEVRVTDDSGKALGTGELRRGFIRGELTRKTCSVGFSFRVSSAPDNYRLIIGEFPPIPYTRENIRRGVSFIETEQGTLTPKG